MASSKEIKEEYTSSLTDLTFNSKPLINVLTILADENSEHASDIVEAIETHLLKVRTEVKLPILYLIDSIMKNLGGQYLKLFSQKIVRIFCNVFESVDEKTREEMYKLRLTWSDVPVLDKKLYALDVQINMLDPAWPVTAAPPTNSIHLNPRFLQSRITPATTTASEKAPAPSTVKAPPVISVAAGTNLDPETLDMQRKLITKQKQLLELQQKKLELELLQAQVKLQEQMKSTNNSNTSKPSTTAAHNLLLKPEVAKQLITTAPPAKTNVSSMPNMRPKSATMTPSNSLNQRHQNAGNAASAGPRTAPASGALASASRPIRDPRLLRQQQKQQPPVISNVHLDTKQPVDFQNKIVSNSKVGVREPRLIANKDDNSLDKKLPKPPPKSRSKNSQDASHKIVKSFRKKSQQQPDNSKGESNKITATVSLLDSPEKIKKPPQSPKSSPSKHKSKKIERYSPKSVKSPTKSELSAQFKDLKVSAKNRNYIRRNRKASESPETALDVDLRLVPPLPEKQSRLQGEMADDQNANATVGMDVDLRQLPAVINKKRHSSENLEPGNSKKSKTEMFDVLFGNEDTDLRQLPAPPSLSPPPTITQNDRPPTPPPPIISSSDTFDLTKRASPVSSPKKSNLDALRAKLASTMKTRDGPNSDVDLRVTPQNSPDKLNRIIISPADELCIKAGKMTKAQETALVNKILAQIETHKLREAQRQESESNSADNERTANTSLQPISDDELESCFSDEETPKKSPNFPFKDSRPVGGGGQEEYPKYQRPDARRPVVTWRGRRRPYDPHVRPNLRPRQPIDPWARGSGPWRPMGPNFGRPAKEDFGPVEVMTIDDSKDEDAAGFSNTNDGSHDIIVDCKSNQDSHKTINIDGVPRDIKYYDDLAIVFLSWDDPREISFQNGSRRIIFDDKEIYTLSFNEPYREINLNGCRHRVRFGAPTRELYVDGKWYECQFGGAGLCVDLDGRSTVVKIEGPPPQVKIGTVKRTDVVCGKINLIVDAKSIVPVFLDATTQKFSIDGETNTLRFTNKLRTALINDVSFKVEFGGLPKPVYIRNRKHFIRFSVLPRGVTPGYVKIRDMETEVVEDGSMPDENSRDGQGVGEGNFDGEPAASVFSRTRNVGGDSPDRNSNSPHMFQSIMQQPNLNNLDVLSSVMSSAITPSSDEGGYQVENAPAPVVSQPAGQPSTANPPSVPPSALNINELFQKLVATGIVTTSVPDNPPPPPVISQPAVSRAVVSQPTVPPPVVSKPPPPVKNHVFVNVKPVTFARPETLKIRQPAVFQMLYTGMQCSSCGMRFPPEQSKLYSQHLDWHFRQNRKGKKNIRKAASRKWYYSLSDWKNYEEIEDLEEREKSYFDQQQAQLEGTSEDIEEEIEIPTVPADADVQDAHCEICQDKFEQFYNEEKEEWHLRMAVRVDGKTYHPLCYEDYQASLNIPIDISAADDETNPKEIEDKRIPGLEIVLDDDDDEEPKKDEAAEENTDSKDVESEIAQEEKVEEKPSEDQVMDEDDDDVIINEVIPEKIIVDDDDENEDGQDEFTGSVKVKEEPIDDGFIDVEGGVLKVKGDGEVKVKTEPKDLDDSLISDVEMSTVTQPAEPAKADVDTTHAELVSSIDGNVELDTGAAPAPNAIAGRIKINISKPIAIVSPKETAVKEPSAESDLSPETFIDPSQPLPPGEEPVQLNVKPALKGVELKKLPVVKRGTELTGLCSIM